MSFDFTVAIPTYNGESRLPKVLERLQNQTGVTHLKWEIIVVDNNSTDNTAKVVQEYQAIWHKDVSFQYFFEAEQGFPFARQRAIKEANGELIGFLDDDNLPALNWVQAAYTFAKEHPRAGAFGSRIHGTYETNPPEELKPIIFYLAIVDRGSQPLIYEPRKKGFPPGAGLVVRRNVWKQHVPSRLFLVGRAGKSFMPAGEDTEALLYIHKAGWEIWYNPAMEIEHVIPSWRLEKTYLMTLMRSIGLGRFHLRMLSLHRWQRPFAFFIYLISDLHKLIIHFTNFRKFTQGEIVAACEMERLIGTLISPFYLSKIKLINFMNRYL
ncbi:glycosyl transferase [Fischerella major NIES-592]|uniref:Glycosyl transferase n=1 Tax=Fischerella major NIES-592 TaxID=210994 RepID=A0A1U7H0D8_9CYAN|nr:hormogonium polysaccharide biosynthesis glycosyltransferase HpsE [Fischerella major]OKH14324.1 glycosyl transferase [Fischerella major NIES-592]